MELLAISRPKLRSLDLSWTDVAADQLEAVLAACGGTLESIVLSGCNPLASLTLTGLAERIGQYAGPRTLQEIRADYGDADAVLEELRGDIGTLAEVVLGFPRLSTFVVLGPSDSDLEMFAALKRQGDRGAGLLDLKKWEDQKEEEDEVGVFGDGRVGVELGKLRKMGRGL